MLYYYSMTTLTYIEFKDIPICYSFSKMKVDRQTRSSHFENTRQTINLYKLLGISTYLISYNYIGRSR